MLAPRFDVIPLAMRLEETRWGVWRAEYRDNRWTKVPWSINGTPHQAASTKAEDWCGFPEAAAFYLRRRKPVMTGIGYRLGDGWTGVDLDHVRDPATNETELWALDVIELLDSYTEVSVSGTGWHIFCRGTLPPGRRRKGNLECYSSGRFFTVSGWGVSPPELGDRTSQLAEFHARYLPQEQEAPPVVRSAPTASDNELVARALSFRNGAKFWSLFNGDTSAHGGDDSAADLALVSELAFVSGGDIAVIDRLFRASRLYRPKWDEKHGAETYGRITINKALAGRTEFYRFTAGDAGVVGRWVR